jgi:glycosyltransferase involved in cell wall biosynthesis
MDKKKLTILFLGNIESPHTAKWVQYFADNGHNVHLVSYNPSSGVVYDVRNAKVYLIEKKIPINTWPFNTLVNFPFTLGKIRKLAKKIKPDIIHAHYITSYGHLGALVGIKPFVATAWGSDILITPKEHWLAKKIVQYVLKKAGCITCDAQHMKKAMISLGASEPKIEIINFGIDTKKFSPGEKNIEFKKSLGFSENDKIVISLRSLEEVYNIETFINSVPLIIKEIPEAKFIIVGRGAKEQELKKMAGSVCLKGSVKFVGRIPNDELPEYLRISDVYVSTSLSDGGIAASTAEAMACAIPAVITDSAENKQWIKDSENGFLIPIKNPEALAEKVLLLLKNNELCRKIGENGRVTICQRNDYYKEMSKMENIYLNLTKNNEQKVVFT